MIMALWCNIYVAFVLLNTFSGDFLVSTMLILLMSTYVYLSTKLKKSKQPYYNPDNVVSVNVKLVDGPNDIAMMLTTF